MYQDPSLIRANVVKLRLNDAEAALVEAITAYTGQQKAALLREMLLEQVRVVLMGGNSAPMAGAREVPHQSLNVA